MPTAPRERRTRRPIKSTVDVRLAQELSRANRSATLGSAKRTSVDVRLCSAVAFRRRGSMALRPIAASTASSGWKASDGDAAAAEAASLGIQQRADPARASADPATAGGAGRGGTSASSRSRGRAASRPGARRRWSVSGPRRRGGPRRRSRPGRRSRGWRTTPPRPRAPAASCPPRPNTTRRPSDWRTAQIQQRIAGGQASGRAPRSPRRSCRCSPCPRAAARRPAAPRPSRQRPPGRPGQGGGQLRGRRRSPAAATAVAGAPARAVAPPAGPRRTAAGPGRGRAGPRRAGPPAASRPVIDPAEVPTHDGRGPRVPAGGLGQGGEHPGVERAAGDPAGAEHQADPWRAVIHDGDGSRRRFRPPGGR